MCGSVNLPSKSRCERDYTINVARATDRSSYAVLLTQSDSKLHLFAYGAELTTLSNESIDYFGVKVDRHYDVHVSEACPSSPEVILPLVFPSPSWCPLGVGALGLSRGLVAGFRPQGRWGCLLAGPSFSPFSPSSSPLLSLAGAWSSWCVLPWALWVSRPLFFVVLRGFLVALYSRFLSEYDWLYVVPGVVFCVYLLLSSCASELSSWAGVEKEFFMIELECSAVDARSSAFQRSSLT